MSKKKINKIKPSRANKLGIEPTKLNSPQEISFSFKYYDKNHPKFSCKEQSNAYWLKVIERLSKLSTMSRRDLETNRSSAIRCHPIEWHETTEESFGLPNEEQLVDTPYQFSISSNEYGRVHGFFIDEVFYIVWLDPNHLLYSSKK